MSLNAGTIEYTVSVETQQSIDAANKVNASLDETEKQMLETDAASKQLNTTLTKLAKSIGAVLSVAAIANEFKKAVATTKEFNQTISNLSALTGLTGPALDDLANKARAIGSTTTLSATQAAGAMQLIGSKAPELLKSAEALDKVTQSAVVLAEASGSDMRVSADILTGVMNQFNMTAEETDRIINTLAAGAKNGASSVESTAAALARAGTQANMSGVSIEQFTALVQTLAKGEITASDAGTALRNTLLILDTAVDKNLRPSVVGMGAALANLEKAQKGGMDMLKMFGRENITAANILIKNRDEYERVTAAVTDTNEAYEQQALRTNNLVGDIAGLNSAYEDLQITVGQLADSSLRTLTQELTKLLIYMGDGEKGSNGLATALEYASVAAQSVAAIVAGRLVMSMIAFGTAQAAAIAGTIRNNQAQALAAGAAVRRAAAEKGIALALLNTAKAEELVARGTNAHTMATNALTAAKSRALSATHAYNVAIAASGAVATKASIAVAALGRAMTFLGGPLGVALLAATALYTLSSSAKDVIVDMTNLKAPLDDVIARLREMDEIARDAELRNMAKGIDQLKSSYRDLGAEVAYAARDMGRSLGDVTDANSDAAAAMEAVKQAGINVFKGLPQEFDDLHESIKANVNITDEYKGQLLDLVARLSEADREGKAAVAQYYNVADAAKNLADETKNAANAVDDLSESMRTGSQTAAEYAAKTSRALEDAKDNTAVGKLSRDIRDNAEAWKTATKEQLDAAYAAAAASDAYAAQRAALRKTTTARKGLTEAQREAKKAEDDAKRGAEANTKAIDDLRESISQTALSAGELAARQAELRLNQYATPEQIALIRELGAELYDINELQRKQDAFGDDVGGKIRGDVPVLQGGGFDDGTARYEAEAEAERQRYAEQLERMVEAEELKLEVAGGYDAMREQLYQEHSDRMAEIDRVRTEMQLTQWAQGFGDMSKGLADFANTFAKENKAMFAVSKAAAIAQAVINTYQAATAAMSAMSAIPVVGPALGIAAAAAAVMGGMAQVANIRSQTMGGGRRYGGAVNENKYYRVNEDGRPEIFKGSDGNQYMMPNQRGEVVSHDDATAGAQRAGNTVNVTQNITMRSDNGNYTARQVMLESSQRQAIAEARLG